jgi:hypothetical protein
MTTTRDRSVIPPWVPGGLARFDAGGRHDGAVGTEERELQGALFTAPIGLVQP